MGGLVGRIERVKITQWGLALSIAGSLLVGFARSGALGATVLMVGLLTLDAYRPLTVVAFTLFGVGLEL